MSTRAEASYQEIALLIIYRMQFELDYCKEVIIQVDYKTSALLTEVDHISSDSHGRHRGTCDFLTSTSRTL